MKKIESDYKKDYGNISRNDTERLKELLNSINLNKKYRTQIFDRINHALNIKWNRVDYTIYLVPKATPRPRYNFMRNTFYVSGAKDKKYFS